MTAMLDATLARWEEAKVAEGRRRGLAEGVERGLAEGVERGLAEGMERGRAEGAERGLAQGRVALLRRQVEWRFGVDVAGQVAALLAEVTDVARLDEVGRWLLECDTGEALLARLRAGGRRAGNGASG